MTTDPASDTTRFETRHGRHPGRYSLTGPMILITLGVMFLVGQFVPGWGVGKTWPALLIVTGVTKLLESAWAGRSMPPR